MSNPGVKVTIKDFGLGILPASSAKIQLKLGLAPLGVVNSIYSAGDLASLIAQLGPGGDLVEAAALVLQEAGGPVYCMPLEPSTYGSPGAVTKTSSGSGSTSTLAVDGKPWKATRVKVVVGGAIGTAKVQISTDGGATWGPSQTTGTTLRLNTCSFLTIAMAAGTYVVGDYIDIATDGTITNSAGYTSPAITMSAQSPLDNYDLLIECIAGGTLGAATFRYSLDNGNTWSGTILVPSSGKYVIPDTGIMLTFTNALVVGDAWSCTVTGPSYTSTEVTAGMTAALADTRTWGFVHVVGPAASASAAAALAASLDAILEGAAEASRDARGIVELPADTDANLLAAIAALSLLRVGGCAGFGYVTSPLSGRQWLASSGWAAAARASAVPISEDLGRVATGALTGWSLTATNTSLPKQRDEAATPGLDAGRFMTFTTIPQRPGVYFTSSRLLAPPGSDYTYWPYGRVMDEAVKVVRLRMTDYINTQIRVNPLTAPGKPGDPGAPGTILEKEARGIEARLDDALREVLTRKDPPDANDVAVLISRTTNIITTSTMPVSVRVQPDAYSRYITVDIGFAVSVGG